MKITDKWLCILFLSFFVNVCLQTTQANAATFDVTNLNDGGAGSLRQAIADANASAGADTIEFQNGAVGTINLLSALPDLSSDITVNGRSGDSSIIRRGSSTVAFRIFTVKAGAIVVLNNLTLQNGSAPSVSSGDEYRSAMGGAIVNDGNLTVRNCKILDNLASANAISLGGGIYNAAGVLTVEKTLFSNNRTPANSSCPVCRSDGASIYNGGSGGTAAINEVKIYNSSGATAIYNTGTMDISDSSISNNQVGGIYNQGFFKLSGSTVANNIQFGIVLSSFFMPRATVTIENSTISGNTNVGSGFGRYVGGIYQTSTSDLQIINSTITDNQGSRAGGLYISGCLSPCKIINTIIAGNRASASSTPDFYSGTRNYVGYNNLIGIDADSNFVSGVDGNIVGTTEAPVNARLSPLGDYGGKTPTHKLLSSSPAINAAHATEFSPTDQRGVPRPVGSVADIGAFEFNLTPHRFLPNGGLNADYNQTLTAFADNPDAAFSFAVSAGNLPPGLSLARQDDAKNAAAIVGVPLTVGTYNFTITASNADNFTISAVYSLTVKNSVSFVPICGRVFSAQNRGIGKAFVLAFDANGNVVSQSLTNPFGYYRLPDVQAEENYTIKVAAKNRRFAPRTVFATGGTDCINFTAES